MGINPRRDNGFTIIETLLVILVLSILALMFVPRYTKDAILKHKVYSAAHDLAGDLRYARQLSMGGGKNGNPAVLPSAAEYDVYYWVQLYQTGSATDSWKIYSMASGPANPIKSSTIPKDIEMIENPTASFYFDKNGAPYPATTGYVEVRDTTGTYRWAVSVARVTGQVKLNQIQ